MFGRKALIALPAIALLLSACGPTPDQVNNSGHGPYANADYSAALDAYETSRERVPRAGEPRYNVGNALYRMENFEESLKEYDEALKYAKGDLRSRGFFNRGNAAFRTQQYAHAVEAYKEVLRMNPDDSDAKHNLELALKTASAAGPETMRRSSPQAQASAGSTATSSPTVSAGSPDRAVDRRSGEAGA